LFPSPVSMTSSYLTPYQFLIALDYAKVHDLSFYTCRTHVT